MDSVKVVCIGHTTLDNIILYNPGLSYFRQPGGGALNSAAGAALWGKMKEVGIVTKLPRDFPSKELEIIRRVPALDLDGLMETNENGLLMWLLYEENNYRQWVMHHNSQTREQAAPDIENIPSRYFAAPAYHIAPLPLPTVERMVSRLPENALIQIDPHYEWFFPKYYNRWLPVLQHTDILLPSEDEFTKLFDIPYGQCIERYIPYLRELLTLGPRIIILKMGAQGALVGSADDQAVYLVPSATDSERIVDFTGAGDSFCGSFLYNYVNDEVLLDCVVRGMVGSGFALEHRGVIDVFGIPSGRAAERYEQVYRKVYSGIIKIA